MSAFSQIQLERLPSPQIIQSLSYEAMLSALLADLQEKDPEYTALVESDPAIKLLEIFAYHKLNLEQKVNDSAKGCMLAYAIGSDLDHLAAYFGVQRQLVSAGDPNARPPIPDVWESDSRLRLRTQLSLEGHTTAGSTGSYAYHGLSASGQVKDIDVYSPEPAYVVVTVLSVEDGDGTPSQPLLDSVFAALNHEEVRPVADHLTVQAPTHIYHYQVNATLYFYEGPDPVIVKTLAETELTEYVAEHAMLGHDIPLSGIYARLHQQGVQAVVLHEPTSNIVVSHTESSYCDSITINVGGIDE